MIDPVGSMSHTSLKDRWEKDSYLDYLAVDRARSFPEESVINVKIISI